MPKRRPVRVLCVSGPNLALLGRREPAVYGTQTLGEIHASLAAVARARGAEAVCRQSDHEGDLVGWIGGAPAGGFDAVIVNPGAYGHDSIALLDALRAAALPAVEVHLSNPAAREPFRRRSRIAPACTGVVSGFGGASYVLALLGLLAHVRGEPAVERTALRTRKR